MTPLDPDLPPADASRAADPWAVRLSEYLDGDLAPAERAALETHLPACAACRAELAELSEVVQRAAALPLRAPDTDLWPGIAARLPGGARVVPMPDRPRRVWELTLPQLAAAGFLVAVLSGGTMWLVASRHPLPPVPGATSAPVARGAIETLPAGFDSRRYDAAIADLEQVLRQHRAQLDPSTVRVIESNLRIIDQATSDARRALASDPSNPYLNDHLAEQLRRKVDVLQQATAVVAMHGGSS